MVSMMGVVIGFHRCWVLSEWCQVFSVGMQWGDRHDVISDGLVAVCLEWCWVWG